MTRNSPGTPEMQLQEGKKEKAMEKRKATVIFKVMLELETGN